MCCKAIKRKIPEHTSAVLFLPVSGDPSGLADLRENLAKSIIMIPVTEKSIERGQVTKATTIPPPPKTKGLSCGRKSLNSNRTHGLANNPTPRSKLNKPT
jgi:hypothetical protein